MATKFYGAIDLIGGGTGALDAIDGTGLNDKDGAFVLDYANSALYFYWLDDDSGAADDGITVIAPDTNAGNKRWLLTTLQSAQWAGLRSFLDSTNMATALSGIGLNVEHAWFPAGAMSPTDTNGCADLTTYEYATNDIQRAYLAFDDTTEEYACFDVVMPSTWDRSTIKFKAYWAPDKIAGTASAAETCEWQVQGISVSNDQSIDTAFTDTGEVISDTVTAAVTDDLHVTGASPAITINGTPALGDLITLKVSRNTGGSDTMVGDAWLFGILVEITHANAVTAW
jgi:hypothetical protein